MKHLLTLTFAVLSAVVFAQTPPKTVAKPVKPAPAQQLNLRFQVKGATAGDAILANYFGDKQYIQDSAKVDANGNFVFKTTEKRDAGIYIVQFPTGSTRKYFEVILLDGQMNFAVESDTTDMIGKMKIIGSRENDIFLEHNLFLAKKSKEMEKLQADMKAAADAKDSITEKKIREQITGIDKEVKEYKRNFYKVKYPESFFAKVLRAMDEPDLLPYDQCPRLPDGKIDSAWNNRNYKEHYWDGFDFTDGRLLRTPVYHNKLKFYLEKITSPAPDSIIKAAHWIIEKARSDSDNFKYAVHYVTYTYEVSKVMGYDAIFVNMVETYHMKKQVWWLSESQLKKVIDRATKLKYSLLGASAVNVQLTDTSGVVRQLQYVNADYTILIFWEPTCGHCKKEIPVIKTYYDSLRAQGVSVEVYAINSEHDPIAWKKFVKDNKLTWVNVMSSDPQLLANYKYYFDVYSTPTVYLLDKQKKIFAKRLDPKGIETFMNRRINEDKKKAKEQNPK